MELFLGEQQCAAAVGLLWPLDATPLQGRTLTETNGTTDYPDTFFEKLGKSLCASTDDLHCLTDSFLIAPAAAIFLLMAPFLFAKSAGSKAEASRTGFTWSVLSTMHRRRFRYVQIILSICLAALPMITAILQHERVIDEEETHVGTVRCTKTRKLCFL